MNRIISITGLVCLLWSWPGHAQPRVIIGVVTDGPMTELERARNLFFGEVLALTENEFEIQFPIAKQLDGGWSIAQIKQSLRRLQQDPEVDIVLALGYVASLVAATATELRKPTFAPLVIDAKLFGLPRRGNTSGVDRLNYLTGETQFDANLEAFRSIVPFERLSLVVDETIFRSVPDLAQRGLERTQARGITLSYVLNTEPDEDLVAKIPADTQAVMVAALPRLNRPSRQRLIAGLLERQLPSFSLIGTTPVREGLLAAVQPDSDWQRLARRNALNIQAVLLGGRAGDELVSFRRKRQLTINMATARALGISPPFDVLSESVVLNEDPPSISVKAWALADVAATALSTNLEIRASLAGVQAGQQNVREARAGLMPQLNAGAGVTQSDDNSTAVVRGFTAERSIDGAVDLSQIIFSESLRASVDVEQSQQDARLAAHRVVELDIIQEATLAFLNVLKSKTLLAIERRDLNLTRTNLELAKDRVRIGSANTSDVFRWESELATTRQGLLRAQARLLQNMNDLNRILHQPIDQRFDTFPATLEDPALLISRKDLLQLINNQRAFERLGRFFVQQALRNSPELLELQAQIESTQRQLLSARRSYWSPEVALSGQLTHVFDEERLLGASRDGESDWQLALNLTLPLYQGGARRARVVQSRFELKQLQLAKQATRDRVEQSVRANLHATHASFPSIELAQQAAVAARKNLDLISDNYSKGTVTILDLLDAQDAALDAEQTATDAVYDFLIDLMNLQRSVAEFDFFLDDPARDVAVEQIKQYVTRGGQSE